MRIALGQLWQETNTFNPVLTTREDFEKFGVLRGDTLLAEMTRTNELGGFIQELRAWPEHPELVGLVRLPAWPSGPATALTFDWLVEELIGSLQTAGRVDAVLLALHGALAAIEHPDVEGEVLQLVRQVVGPTVPVVASLDLHANITPAMVHAADALVLYHTMPHVDILSTGRRAARLLRRILIDGAQPRTAFIQVPAVLPAERANTEEPGSFAARRKQKLIELEQQPKILAAGVAVVQPWLDVPQLGSAVVVTTDRDDELARQIARVLANELWATREEYMPELVTIEDAVRSAHSAADGLTVLSDAADATTSGAPGDSVWILRELLQYAWQRPALVTVVDEALVHQLETLGVGAPFDGQIGGLRDHRFGIRIPMQATVERLFDARFVLSGHIGNDLPIDMGRSAVLARGNVKVIVTSRSGPHFAPELFQAAGLDPFAAAVVVAKSPCGFRAVYASRAARIHSVRAPGCAPTNFWEYTYEHRPRPLWPWEPDLNWST